MARFCVGNKAAALSLVSKHDEIKRVAEGGLAAASAGGGAKGGGGGGGAWPPSAGAPPALAGVMMTR
jgi:hypothetical protein